MLDFKTDIWEQIKTRLLESLFPSKCLVCENFFSPSENIKEDIQTITYQNVLNTFLCPECMKISLIDSPIYGDRSIPLRQFRIAYSYAIYDPREKEKNSFEELIRQFKYSKKNQLALPFSMLLFSTFIRCWDKNDIDRVMPVPLHIKRLRKRGFNQAYLLVKDWHRIAKDYDIDLSYLRVEWEGISRIRETTPQIELTGKDRENNIKGAFKVKHASKIRGKKILLIDDVYTTGATVNECSKELLNSGARYVDVLTLARRI